MKNIHNRQNMTQNLHRTFILCSLLSLHSVNDNDQFFVCFPGSSFLSLIVIFPFSSLWFQFFFISKEDCRM